MVNRSNTVMYPPKNDEWLKMNLYSCYKGPSHDPGINQRALQELFRETADRSEEWEYVISVSVVEIYNEIIR